MWADIATVTRLLSDSDRWNDAQSFAIGALYMACLRTSGSALVLIVNGRIWDADILIRTVIEDSLKITYILCNSELFDERFAEFSEALFDIEGIKQHRKAEMLLKTLEDPEADQWIPIREVLLPEGLLRDISEKYPRSYKRAIETRWGFTGLVGQLINEELPATEMFVMLLHGYSMASHHLHADYSGVFSALDRDTREEEKKGAVSTDARKESCGRMSMSRRRRKRGVAVDVSAEGIS